MEMLKHSLEVNSFSADSNKTGNVSEKKSHKRTKRFLSYPRFVEVMVVADSRMVAYHGANLQHYVLTLMSIVSIQLGVVHSPTDHCLVASEHPFCCVHIQYHQVASAGHGDNAGIRLKLGEIWLGSTGWSLPPSQVPTSLPSSFLNPRQHEKCHQPFSPYAVLFFLFKPM